MKIQLTFILLIVPSLLAQNNPYCFLESCPGRSHTLCRFDNSRKADTCGPDVDAGLTIDQRNEIRQELLHLREVSIYNRFNALENGYHDMSLIWDAELTSAAQRWANQCQNRLDQCRNVGRFAVEQKVATVNLVRGALQSTLRSVVQDWYFTDSRTHFDSPQFNQSQHLRSVWESATLIGCGSTTTADDNGQMYIVCNFAPVDYQVEFDPNYVWYSRMYSRGRQTN